LSDKLFFIFDRSERQLEEVVIALVGKYTALEDAYASVLKALNHAALFCNRKLNIRVRIDIYIFVFVYIHKLNYSLFMQQI
jgi:CTP synthase (UTP-ammonia lyase)